MNSGFEIENNGVAEAPPLDTTSRHESIACVGAQTALGMKVEERDMKNRPPRKRNARMLLAMNEARMSTALLAQRAGICRQTVSMTLGRRIDPRPETWAKIAVALNVRPADIMEAAT